MLFFHFSIKRRVILSWKDLGSFAVGESDTTKQRLLPNVLQRVRLFRSSPQTAGGVTQQQGGLKLDLVFVAVRDAAPARVRDDDRVGQRGQSVADDGHLHRVA